MIQTFIHETADVSDEAKLSENVKVWNLAQIRENAEVGKNTIISKNVYIDYEVKIGANVKIQNNVSVYHGVTIEDDVFVGPSAVFTNDLRPRAVKKDWKITQTVVKKGASIGANATLVCGIEIGRYAMIGSGAVISKSVPPHALVVGNPGKMIGFVYSNGEKVQSCHLKKVCSETKKVIFVEPMSEESLSLSLDSLKILPC
jgi:acetyltransferase-like isoleucine patch superfamily enzyme